jgi:nitroimidazol reductase NimA-like FMN-containing flavoprotein (pyridoxamine 5'-phosphate oxidase superfamily)
VSETGRVDDGEAMTADACWTRLDAAPNGRLVLQRHGRPVVFPVNHVTDGRTIVFRTGANSVVGLMASHQPVTYEVDDADVPAPTGWRVVLSGEIERIDRQDRDRIVPQPTPWAPGRVEAWIRIRPTGVTGRVPAGSGT